MWSISGGRGLTKAIEDRVTPAGFTTMIRPEKLTPGHVYAGHASDGHGGSSSLTFGFDKDGTMVFPIDSTTEGRIPEAFIQSKKPTAP